MSMETIKDSNKPVFYFHMYRNPTKKEIRQLVMFGVSCLLGIVALIATAKLEDKKAKRLGY